MRSAQAYLKHSGQYYVLNVCITEYLMFLKEFLEVVGAGSEDTAVSAELDVFDHHSNVTVFALQPLLVQQLQEDALMFIIHVLHRLRHLHPGHKRLKSPSHATNEPHFTTSPHEQDSGQHGNMIIHSEKSISQ